MRILRCEAKTIILVAKVLHGRQAGSGAAQDHRRAMPAQGGDATGKSVSTDLTICHQFQQDMWPSLFYLTRHTAELSLGFCPPLPE